MSPDARVRALCVAASGRLNPRPRLRYELPDGARIDVGIDRFKAAELILDPAPLLVASSAGELPALGLPATASAVDPTTAAECDAAAKAALRAMSKILDAEPPTGVHASRAGAPQMLCTAAFKCERELHATLLGNVVLAGGARADGCAFSGGARFMIWCVLLARYRRFRVRRHAGTSACLARGRRARARARRLAREGRVGGWRC